MKRILFLILIQTLHLYCSAQSDSSYIKQFEHKLAVRAYLGQDYLMMTQEFSQSLDKTFTPNSSIKIGFGFSLNNTILDLSYGLNLWNEKKKGATRSFDFQIHNYGRKFVFDLFFQRYQGFYNDDSKNIEIYPDLRIRNYGISGLFILNNHKYSYKAAFNQSEKQLKSAGSFLLGIGLYHIKIDSDSSFIYKQENDLSCFQLGINAGYAYTWTLSKYWDISASSTLGLGLGIRNTREREKWKFEISPMVFPRITAGYNRNDWSIGFSIIGNITFPAMSRDENISILSGRSLVTYTKRFKSIPFFEK
jgi:hypothetical protein